MNKIAAVILILLASGCGGGSGKDQTPAANDTGGETVEIGAFRLSDTWSPLDCGFNAPADLHIEQRDEDLLVSSGGELMDTGRVEEDGSFHFQLGVTPIFDGYGNETACDNAIFLANEVWLDCEAFSLSGGRCYVVYNYAS